MIARALAALMAAALSACQPVQSSYDPASGLYFAGKGSYRVAKPASWDGRSELPVVLFMHGAGQTSAQVLADRAAVDAVTGSGALLVVPDGVNGGWSFTGSWAQGRDDVGFLAAVMADVKQRWPVDRRHVIAAGFSVGASMVWDLACHHAAGFAAFLPVSGDFWLPYPASCESGPVNLRHVHGRADHVFPIEGRVTGAHQQGALLKSWDILRAADQCAATPDRTESEAELTCEVWTSCASGREIELRLHDGAHEMNPAALKAGIAWALALH